MVEAHTLGQPEKSLKDNREKQSDNSISSMKGRGEPEGKDCSGRKERAEANTLKLESSLVNSIELDEMKLCDCQ